jgi:hypothetical protein
MPDTTNVAQLYQELLQLFEAAQHLQAQSTHLLEDACRARPAIPAVSDAVVPLDAIVALSPEQTLDAMIVLLSDFSLETQVAITKALALGMAATARTRLHVKRPSVA